MVKVESDNSFVQEECTLLQEEIERISLAVCVRDLFRITKEFIMMVLVKFLTPRYLRINFWPCRVWEWCWLTFCLSIRPVMLWQATSDKFVWWHSCSITTAVYRLCFIWFLWFSCWLNRCDSRRILSFTLFFWNSCQICLYFIAADAVILVEQTSSLSNCACFVITCAFIPLRQRSSNLLNSLNLSQNNRFPRNVNQGTEIFLNQSTANKTATIIRACKTEL